LTGKVLGACFNLGAGVSVAVLQWSHMYEKNDINGKIFIAHCHETSETRD